MRKYHLHKNIFVCSGLILQITFSTSLTCVPSDTFNTGVCLEQREFCHTCLQKTILGEGASPGAKSSYRCGAGDISLSTRQVVWMGQENGLRLTTVPICLILPVSQRKARGPGYVLAPSAGKIEHRHNPTLILSCVICFKVRQPWNTNSLRSKPP